MLMMMFCLMLTPVDGDVYGRAPSDDTPLIAIETLMNDPEAYLGKVVRVKGEVKEVCPKAGCWLDIVGDGNQVRVKVKDGEIVFDAKLEGRTVIAEGTVYKFDLTREQAVSYFEHLAEEKGESFDPATITEGTTIYQLGGIGVTTAVE